MGDNNFHSNNNNSNSNVDYSTFQDDSYQASANDSVFDSEVPGHSGSNPTGPQQPNHFYAYPQQPAYPHPQMIAYQPTKQERQQRRKFVVEKNLGFLQTWPGVLNLINIVLLFFGWITMVVWRVHNGSFFVLVHQKDGSSFYFVTTLVPFFLFIGYVVAVVTSFHKRITIVDLNLTVVVHCALCAILLVASSAIVVRQEENNHCTSADCEILDAAAAFGFLAAAGILVEGILYFKRWRCKETVH